VSSRYSSFLYIVFKSRKNIAYVHTYIIVNPRSCMTIQDDIAVLIIHFFPHSAKNGFKLSFNKIFSITLNMSTFSEFTISLMANNIISAQQLHIVGPLGSERIKILLLVKIPNKLGDNQMSFLFNRCGKWPTTYYKRRTAGCRQHVSTQIKRCKFKPLLHVETFS